MDVVRRRVPTVVVGAFRDLVEPAPIVVRLDVVDALRRPRRLVVETAVHEVAQPLGVAVATHVVGDEIAKPIVPKCKPARTQLPRDRTPETPRLRNQDQRRFDRLQRVLDLAQDFHREQLRQVKSKAVDVVGFHEVNQAVDNEPLRHRRLRPQRVAAAAPVGERAAVLDLKETALVDEQQKRRFAHMVVDHIQNHCEAAAMAFVHQFGKLLDL